MLGSLPADNGLVDSVAIKGGVGGEATDVGAERDGGGVSLGEPNSSRGLDVGLLATGDDNAVKLISFCFCAGNRRPLTRGTFLPCTLRSHFRQGRTQRG